MVEAEHGADMEHRVQSRIPANRGCFFKGEKGVQQSAPEQPREQDGLQRRQGNWSRFQNDQSRSLCSLREEKFLSVEKRILNKLNFKLS